MIRTWAIVALIVLSLALALRGQLLEARAVQAEGALSNTRARLMQVEKANKAYAEHIAEVEAQAAQYEADDKELETMEGADAPLSDYLRAADRILQ